jgi:hypothetical protein
MRSHIQLLSMPLTFAAILLELSLRRRLAVDFYRHELLRVGFGGIDVYHGFPLGTALPVRRYRSFRVGPAFHIPRHFHAGLVQQLGQLGPERCRAQSDGYTDKDETPDRTDSIRIETPAMVPFLKIQLPLNDRLG